MKARFFFMTEVTVEVPDGFTDSVRKQQEELGDLYLTKNSSDEEILERLAIIRGLRGFSYDEAMDEALNKQVVVTVEPDEEPFTTRMF